MVRLEQNNDTLVEMGHYDDGPFEVGDESDKNPDLVPAPPNSYLGIKLIPQLCSGCHEGACHVHPLTT